MKKIFNIIKKNILSISIIIVLLISQAYCDLKLPEFTSNIINVGIQQQGIESNVLEAMSTDTMEILTVINKNDNLYNYYNLVNQGDKKYINEYSYLKEHDLYILKDNLSDKELDKLSKELKVAEVFYAMLGSSGQMNEMGYSLDATALRYLLTIEPEADTPESLAMKGMYKTVSEIDETMLDQYAINFVAESYKKLDIDVEAKQMSYLISSGIRMVLFSLLIMVIIVITAFISSRVSSRIAFDLRNLVVDTVMSYSNKEYNEISTSSLITRSTNDIQQIQMFFTLLLRMIMYAPIVGVGALVKVIHIDIAWVIGLAVGAILLLVITLVIIALPKFRVVQKLIDRLNQIVRETLNGLPVIKAFSNEDFEKKKFEKANKDLYKVNLFTHKVMAFMSPIMMLIMNGIIVLIFWLGTDSIDKGTLQIGTLTALISYTMQIIMAFLMLSMLSIMGPRAIISINRVSEILNKKSSIRNKEKTTKFDNDKIGLVEFDNVSFKYPDGEELVLENVSFKVLPGTTTAIIGSTGSGKSSIINLIPRFFDITEGSLKVNGVDVRDASLEDLRASIGVVPQKGLLFSGTVESNIKFSDESMSDENMKKAADIACASEFIEKLDNKYQYEISQGGTNVSGGQRQRLAIARAVAKNADIYIFDDSFSALDYKTDSIVRSNLNKECADATKIIVAQRVATVMNADQIIVLDQGKVVGIGTHKELYKNCKIYKEIALSQLKEEELV